MTMQQKLFWGILSLLITAGVWAQTPTRFEVATIRLHQNTGDPSQNDLLPGGRFTASNIPLKKLLRIALDVEDDQLTNLPGWADTAGYDIDARTGTPGILSIDVWRKLTLALLEERFQLRFHRVPKERTVYALTVAKGGPRLTPHTGEGEQAMSMNGTPSSNVLKASKVTTVDLAAVLARATRRKVEDRTGLTGTYDVQLEWARNDAADAQGPSIFSAVEEQLGLKLATAKGMVDNIVLDHLEPPSGN